VERVTADDLKRVAIDIFRTDSLNLAVVGPQGGRFEKNIKKLLSFPHS